MIEEIDKTYEQIENKILNHEIYQNVKDYSKTKEKIKTYLEVGELLKNVNTKYGKNVIKDYSKRLTKKFGKKYLLVGDFEFVVGFAAFAAGIYLIASHMRL